ncbi:LysR family transcriptional regulator [Phenylobacterium conjunctum]|uniref:LysR family transcriptional regulator n=1 Tax=Phenylobacterium conjunctum TaxID=1298959 RepID=A0ABW3SZC4_9CAUL
MEALNLVQLETFVAVAEAGSFSAAARTLGRAQSAVSYQIQGLEAQAGVELFDRTAYRPVLSEAGRALLARARRILEDVEGFRSEARGMAGGLEPELSLVIEAMFPMNRLLGALTDFQAAFPTVRTRVRVETLGAAAEVLLDDGADLGLIITFADRQEELDTMELTEVELVAVAAPAHPLAREAAPLTEDQMREHLQLVLSDRSSLTRGQDRGVIGLRTWRLADLGAKHAMLLAGLGWGSMPRHMVLDDLAEGRLVELKPVRWGGMTAMPRLPVALARRKTHTLGPAGRWLQARLLEDCPGQTVSGKVSLASSASGG